MFWSAAKIAESDSNNASSCESSSYAKLLIFYSDIREQCE